MHFLRTQNSQNTFPRETVERGTTIRTDKEALDEIVHFPYEKKLNSRARDPELVSGNESPEVNTRID